jgi:hypothetical protein
MSRGENEEVECRRKNIETASQDTCGAVHGKGGWGIALTACDDGVCRNLSLRTPPAISLGIVFSPAATAMTGTAGSEKQNPVSIFLEGYAPRVRFPFAGT